MELSSKLKAMKFMKRKDDAEDRKTAEKDQQKAAERTHWTLSEDSSVSGVSLPKHKFIVEYDSTGQGLLTQPAGAIGRQSFKNYNKSLEPNSAAKPSTGGPSNKLAKLADNSSSVKNKS